MAQIMSDGGSGATIEGGAGDVTKVATSVRAYVSGVLKPLSHYQGKHHQGGQAGYILEIFVTRDLIEPKMEE
jgi:hypothetical protein